MFKSSHAQGFQNIILHNEYSFYFCKYFKEHPYRNLSHIPLLFPVHYQFTTNIQKRFSNWIYKYSGAAAPPDFQNPKKLSHKNAIKPEFSEKWGKIGLLAPPDFWSSLYRLNKKKDRYPNERIFFCCLYKNLLKMPRQSRLDHLFFML